MSRINQALHQMKLQDWALKIKDQASSGLLVSEWCAQNHVTCYQFHYWKRLVKEAAIEQMLPEIVPLPPSTPDYSGAPEPVNPIFRATLSAWQSHSE